jgi:hypothetical protein
MGGYLAGRLRTKWVQVHTDEVYFRDTAHGLLVWALGMVVTAAFLTSAATSIAGGATLRNNSEAAPPNAAESSVLSPHAYFVDALFRSNDSGSGKTDLADRSEAELILSHAMRQGSISSADKSYLAQMVSARTGISPSAADQRVSDLFAEAQQSADNARKALAHLSLWLFVALLSGAFCASYAGTVGGKQRDRVLNSL